MTQLADLSFTKQLPVRHVNDDLGVYLVNSKLLVAEEASPPSPPPVVRACAHLLRLSLAGARANEYTYYRQYFFLTRCEEKRNTGRRYWWNRHVESVGKTGYRS
jgi:hypothetical protein